MAETERTHLPLGEAIALALHERLSQSALARELGVSQPAVNQWVQGATRPRLEDIARIEASCRRPRGFILRAAGYVEDAETFEQVLEARIELDDAGRSVVLAAYHGIIDHYGLIGGPEDASDPGQLKK